MPSYSANAAKENAAHLSINGTSTTLPNVAAHLGWAERLRLFAGNFFSFNHYYLLRSALSPIAETQIGNPAVGEIHRLPQADWSGISDQLQDLQYQDKKELLARLRFYQDGFTNCYALKDNRRVVYAQWIVYPSENEIITRKYKGRYTLLKSSQVMFEHAFTWANYRDRGFHLYASAQLMRLAREQGYTNAVCYIRKDNLASLNAFLELGFQMTKIIPEYKIFGWVRRSL